MTPRAAMTLGLVAVSAGGVLVMVPGLPGWILLAAVGGIVATRGWVRVAVCAATALIAAGLAAVAVGQGAWPAVIGGMLAFVAAVWGAFAGRSWPAMGARYQRDNGERRSRLSDWDALDAGIDPTDGP